MSLMNDMLRDLEKRQAPDRTQQIEAQGYGALTQKTESHSSRAVILLLGIIIVMLVVLAIGWWYIQTTPQTSNRAEVPIGVAVQSHDANEGVEGVEGVVVGRVERATDQILVAKAPQTNITKKPLLDDAVQPQPAAVSPSSSISQSNAQPELAVEPEKVNRTLDAQASSAPVEELAVENVSAPVPTKKILAEPANQKANASDKAPDVSTKKAVTKKVVAGGPNSESGAISKVLVISPEQRDEQMADSAEALMASGNRQAAKTQLMAFIDEHDSDVKSRALLASLLMQDGNMAGANALLTDDKVSESSHLRRLKAHWLTQAGQPNEAVALLNSARPDIAADPEYHVLLAALYQQQGFSSEAVATYAELLSYNPDVADWWVGMAIALDSSQQYPSAKKAYQKALKMEGLRFELADFAKQRLATLGG